MIVSSFGLRPSPGRDSLMRSNDELALAPRSIDRVRRPTHSRSVGDGSPQHDREHRSGEHLRAGPPMRLRRRRRPSSSCCPPLRCSARSTVRVHRRVLRRRSEYRCESRKSALASSLAGTGRHRSELRRTAWSSLGGSRSVQLSYRGRVGDCGSSNFPYRTDVFQRAVPQARTNERSGASPLRRRSPPGPLARRGRPTRVPAPGCRWTLQPHPVPGGTRAP